MKKLLILLLALMLCSPAAAETEGTLIPIDVSSAVQGWKHTLTERCGALASEDLAAVADQIALSMDITSLLMMTSADVEHPGSVMGDMVFRQPLADAASGLYHSGTQLLEDFGFYFETEVQYTDTFFTSLLSMYQPDGTLLGIQRVEIGLRDDAFMALLVDYDHTDGLTGRFALYPLENDPRLICTKTIGKTLDICLDVRAWTEGADYSAWSKSLLLPAAFMYQPE